MEGNLNQGNGVENYSSLYAINKNLIEGIYRIELEKNFIYVNDAFLKITGFSSIEEINKYNYIHNFYAIENERAQLIDRIKREGQIINYETQLINKNGEAIWILENSSLVNENGTIYLDGAILNIEERKRVKEELYDSKTQLLIKKKIETELEFRNREIATQILHSSQKQNLLDEIDFDLQLLKKKYPLAIQDLNKISRKIRENNYLDDSWDSFKLHFEQVHPSFFNKLLQKHSNLKQGHLKQCAYIRIGLSNKEVAQLLNISSKGVEMARYRLKKKLFLTSEDSLIDYLFDF